MTSCLPVSNNKGLVKWVTFGRAEKIGLTRRGSQQKITPPVRSPSLIHWWRSHPVTCFAAISALWVGVLYWRALSAPFVYDDTTAISQNPTLSSWHSVATYFRSCVPLSNEYRGYAGSIYRPLLWFGFIVERHLWGLNAFGFHLTNLLLHWLNGLLAFSLLRKLRVSLSISLLACLIWLGLPINAETVAWVSGRSTCQATMFIFLSLLAALSYARSGRPTLLLCYFLALAGAMFTNEWGTLALPLTGLVLVVAGLPRRRIWLTAGGVATGGLVLYLALRHAAGAHLPIRSVAVLPVGISVVKYVTWMLLPLRMSVERSSDLPPNVLSLASAAALAALLCLLVFIFRFRKRVPEAAAGLSWMLIAVLPFSGIVFIYQGMAERYTYLAAGGLVLAIVAITFRAAPSIRPYIASIIFLWAIWGAWRLRQRVMDWNDEVSLYETSLQATPRSPVLLYNLGSIFAETGHIDKAIQYYQRALSLNPKYVSALINLGNLFRSRGDYGQAMVLYTRARLVAPEDPDLWVNLGDTYLQTNSMQEAKSAYQKAISLNPHDVAAITNLGVTFQSLGDFTAAKQQYERAISLDPTQDAAYCDLGVLLLRERNVEGAYQQFRRAIEKNPSSAQAYFDLGVLYQKTDRPDLAAQMYEKALEIRPDDEKARLSLDRLRMK